MENLRSELEILYNDKYRKIWVQHHSKEKMKDIVITLFPSGSVQDYQILVIRDLPDFNTSTISKEIDKRLGSL